MIKKMDHVAFVVKDAAKTAKTYADLFGFKQISTMDSPAFASVMLGLGDIHLELFQPLAAGPMKDFLDKQGGGLYHISFLTDDIVKEIKNIKDKGKKMRQDEPMVIPGARIAFLEAAGMDNVSIELAERK